MFNPVIILAAAATKCRSNRNNKNDKEPDTSSVLENKPTDIPDRIVKKIITKNEYRDTCNSENKTAKGK
jgi:hypothetical protein